MDIGCYIHGYTNTWIHKDKGCYIQEIWLYRYMDTKGNRLFYTRNMVIQIRMNTQLIGYRVLYTSNIVKQLDTHVYTRIQGALYEQHCYTDTHGYTGHRVLYTRNMDVQIRMDTQGYRVLYMSNIVIQIRMDTQDTGCYIQEIGMYRYACIHTEGYRVL